MNLSKPLFLFDGDCGFCQWSVNHLRKYDRQNKFQILPYQSFTEEELKPFQITYAKLEKGIQVITQKKKVYSGALGINYFLFQHPVWKFAIAPLYILPPLLLIEILVYNLIAKNRRRLSARLGLKACSLENRPKRNL